MRMFFSGPRILGGLIRPGVSFRIPRYASASSNAAAAHGEYVYVIENERGETKIGFGTDPRQRLRELQTGSPDRLSIAFTTFGADRAFDIEQGAHAILDRHRLVGEWFAVPKDAAIASVYASAARLGAPIGQDAMIKGISMERKLFAWIATGILISTALTGMALFPTGANRVIVGAAVVGLILWRLSSSAASD